MVKPTRDNRYNHPKQEEKGEQVKKSSDLKEKNENSVIKNEEKESKKSTKCNLY